MGCRGASPHSLWVEFYKKAISIFRHFGAAIPSLSRPWPTAEETRCVCETLCPRRQQSPKMLFLWRQRSKAPLRDHFVRRPSVRPSVCPSVCPSVTLCFCWRHTNSVEFLVSIKVTVKVNDLGVIWKGIISWVCMPSMKSPSLYGSKVIAKVKVDNRQTNKQTDRTKAICPRSFDLGA